MNTKILSLLAVGAAAHTASAGPMGSGPWDYAVYGVSGVGTPSSRLTGSVHGTVGSAGGVYMGSISVNAGAGGYAVVSGGVFDLSGGSVHGDIYSLGDATLTSATATGSLVSAGTLYGSGGSVSGSASAAGGNASTLSFGGGFHQAAPADVYDGAGAAAYFTGLNQGIAQMATTASYTNEWGKLSISAGSGLNIVDITAAALDAAWGVQVAGPSDATVVLRISGVSASLDSVSWIFTGGAQASNVLANYFEAESLNLSGGHTVSFLAPNAGVVFSGNLTGTLVGETITGGGSITGRAFTGDLSAVLPVPAPGGVGVLLGCGVFVFTRRRRA